MDDKTRTLLMECRRWIDDARLHAHENDTRKRSETQQEHADRLSMNIEMNCNRADLLAAIDDALAVPQAAPLDVCTDPDNCKRCKATAWEKHRHEHAGLRPGA